MKTSDPGSLASISGNTSLAQSRQATVDQANRSTLRVTTSSSSQATAPTNDIWVLPMQSYQITKPFADSDGDKSVTLAASEGTPFYASHTGTVKLARWDGAYGYTVIVDVGNNVQLIYCHASKLLVREGQKINSGDLLALTGNTGYAFEPGLHFEVRVNGATVDPIAYLADHGVDLTKKTDSYSALNS